MKVSRRHNAMGFHFLWTLEFMSKWGVHECPSYTPIEYSWAPIRCWLDDVIPAPKQRMSL